MTPPLKVSRPSLYRWRAAYKYPCDLGKLVDTRGGDRCLQGSPEAWEEFRALYLHANRPKAREVWRIVKRHAADNGWKWCTYQSLMYQLNTRIPPQEQTKVRDPATYRSALSPYIPQDQESHEAGRMWIGDHKLLDLVCWWGGQKIRPTLTTWMDWRTRKIVGYLLTDSPNSSTIMAAFRDGMLDKSNRGGPDEVWIDNGRDYSAFVFHGTTKKERRANRGVDCKVNEQAANGLFDRLSIKAHFATPYGPNGKARLERWFGQLSTFARTFATYTGDSVDTKPEQLNDVLKNPTAIPSFEDVARRVADFIQGENNDADHDIADLAENGVKLSPAAAFDRWARQRVFADEAALDLCFLMYPRDVYVGRQGVGIFINGMKVWYGAMDLTLAPFKAVHKSDRQAVRVGYDPKDITSVRVFLHDWTYLCTVEKNTVGGGTENAHHVREALKRQARYDRAEKTKRKLEYTQLLTNSEQISVVANERPSEPPQAPLSIRPVRTPHDGQAAAIERQKIRMAAGAEHRAADDDALTPGDWMKKLNDAPPPPRQKTWLETLAEED